MCRVGGQIIEYQCGSRYSQLGLFNCWIGHNYPIPRWARWPNQNGVIHTISIGDNLFAVLRIISSFFKWQFYFILYSSAIFVFRHLCNVCFQMALQRLYGICTEMVVTYMGTLYIIAGCSSNSSRRMVLYFNWYTTTQKYATSRKGSLCHGSNSPRVHRQLM